MSSEAHEVRVRLAGLRKYKGYSDLVETYCCSATSCYYVVFPAIGYEGYFQKADVEIKRRDEDA
jgi:hypothetical protein